MKKIKERKISIVIKTLRKVVSSICLFLSILITFSSRWALSYYCNISFDEILFHLTGSVVKAENSILEAYRIGSLMPSIYLFVILEILIIIINILTQKYVYRFKITIRNKKVKFSLNGKTINFIFKALIVICIGFQLVKAVKNIGFIDYAVSQTIPSSFIEENYADVEKVKLTFPERKRNLIYVYVESLESSYFNKTTNGLGKVNLMPELGELSKEGINFSNNSLLGGFYSPYAATWTSAAMVAHTSGLPVKIPGNVTNETKLKNYLKGIVSMGEILEKNGYNQEIMMGSDSNFGNRKLYFTEHGNYDIYDYYTAIEKGKITSDYHEWWGFEDSKLFEFSKEEITKLANEDKPFNYTMLTADTHFPDGYLYEYTENKYDNRYSNVIAHTSKQLYDFINWIKEQSFYENTTVVIAGDHLTMKADYFDGSEESERRVFNLFLNSAVNTDNSKNRNCSTFDMFPTTLASMGVKIDGNKLALGTNLFSNEKTLVDKYGIDEVNKELEKRSVFYNKKFI